MAFNAAEQRQLDQVLSTQVFNAEQKRAIAQALQIGIGYTSAATTVPAVATANATDLATAQALANQLKTSLNAALTSLKNAGIMA